MPTQQKPTPSNFIPLNNIKLGCYTFLFKVPPSYHIKTPEQFSSKTQLYFLDIKPKRLFTNLEYVDSVFYRIWADAALLLFLGKIKSMEDYISSPHIQRFTAKGDDEIYLRHKFWQFLHYLLYGDIGFNKAFTGNTNLHRIYCLKDAEGQLQYFPLYVEKELMPFLMKELKLRIEPSSVLLKQNVFKFDLVIQL